jgi:dipeptidyl aminopeptidase/acylaminoacyl peptidase
MACSVLGLCAAALAQSSADLAQRFGHLPDVERPRLSPDGRYLAMQIPRDGVPAILSVDLSGKDEQQWLLGTTPGGFKIADCQWAKSDRLICLIDYTAVKNSQPHYEFAVFSLAADGKGSKEILIDEPWVRLVNRLPSDPENIAIEKLSAVGWPALYLLNVYTGRSEILAPARPPATRWELSDDGETAVAFGIPAAGRTTLDFGNPEFWSWSRSTREFSRLAPKLDADVYVDLVGLDSMGRNALVLGTDGDRQSLLALPLDGGPHRTLIRDERYDVTVFDTLPALTHRAGRVAVLTDTNEHRWLDAGMANSQRQLNALRSGAIATVETSSHDMQRSVVRFEADAIAPYYVLFDAGAQPRVIGKEYPDLEELTLAATRVVRVLMRDEVEIDVLVTEPPRRADGALRAVVIPHGGPEARDYRHFDFIVQFLAARGYVVLQPNFRGSWGYGREFLEAGRRSWGTVMHNDITDTARWAIDTKLAEPGHVCIVGASYGGYAALLGATKEPDLYACAVSIAGPSDLGNLLWDFDKTGGPRSQRLARDRIGWDRDELEAQSPLASAANAVAPVLLIHGRLDSRVEPDHSERMARALRKLGKPVELVIQRNGDHFLSDEAQRIEMLSKIGEFLSEHL